jgi:hypothetical protein
MVGNASLTFNAILKPVRMGFAKIFQPLKFIFKKSHKQFQIMKDRYRLIMAIAIFALCLADFGRMVTVTHPTHQLI